jgi:hypothetical protein
MATVTLSPSPRKNCKPVARSIRLSLAPFEGNPGIVTIQAGKAIHDYFVLPLASDFGRAFRLEKFSGELAETYHVNLDMEQGKHLCDCKGSQSWGRCKHVDGLAALLKAGKL